MQVKETKHRGMSFLLILTVLVVVMITSYFYWISASFDTQKELEIITLKEKLRVLEEDNQKTNELMRQVFGYMLMESSKHNYRLNCSQCAMMVHDLSHKLMHVMTNGFQEISINFSELKHENDDHDYQHNINPDHNPNSSNSSNPLQAINQTNVTLPHYRLAIGILSSYKREQNRKIIRETWLKYLEGTPYAYDWTYRFIMGDTNDTEVKLNATLEAMKYKDMLFIPVMDSYRNISWKTLYTMQWATEAIVADYVMKIDDDSFLRLDRLMLDLEKRPKKKLYFGKSHGKYRPDRSPKSQWYITVEEYPAKFGPTLIAGPGYVVSGDCAKFMVDISRQPGFKPIYLEDVNTAVMLEKYGVSGVADRRFFTGWGQCRSDMILSHYATELMYKFYTNSRTGDGNMCRQEPTVDHQHKV